jgi:hypothetical protein
VLPKSAARRIAAKAWTASGAPASPMSSDKARSNQICAESFCSSGADASGLDVSAAFGDELTAAMATAAAPILVVILIVTSR